MSENNRDGLLVIGIPVSRDGQVIVQQGNDADIEATKRQGRALVEGSNPLCFQAFIVETRFSVTAEHNRERKG